MGGWGEEEEEEEGGVLGRGEGGGFGRGEEGRERGEGGGFVTCIARYSSLSAATLMNF